MRTRGFYRTVNFRLRIRLKWVLLVIIILLLIITAIPLVSYLAIANVYSQKIYLLKTVPEARVGIILGEPGDSSDANLLADRISTAAELYESGKIQKLLINSSDGRSEDSVEGQAIKAGIHQFDLKIEKDVSGIYDSCFTARNVYSIDKAVIITQDRYMLPALYACNSIGIDSSGVIADKQLYINNPGFLANFGQVFNTFWKIYVQEPDIVIKENISL